jgi:hypothetical protein
MDRFFGTSDAYSHYLVQLGHEAHEVVVNCGPLQRAWARERGMRSVGWPRLDDGKLVLAQAEEFGADVVYVQDVRVLSARVLRKLQARSSLLVGQIATQPPRFDRLGIFDLLLTSFPHFVHRFQEQGLASEYVKLGFDPRVIAELDDDRRTGAVFVGAIGPSPIWRSNALIQHAAERVPVDFWGYKVGPLPADSAIHRGYRGEAWGLEMYRVLARSRIALNRHGDVAEGYANNMRLFEATGVGTLLITDAKRNLADLFKADDEVVTYSSEGELVEKIRHYLENEAERARIARAGQDRTLRDHTYEHRMRELAAILARHMR